MRDDAFITKSGIVILHPTDGTHWTMFVDEFYLDSYDCPPPLNVIYQSIRGIYSEYQIQRNNSYCASYCLYVLNLTQMKGFKNAGLVVYYLVSSTIKEKNNGYQLKIVSLKQSQPQLNQNATKKCLENKRQKKL